MGEIEKAPAALLALRELDKALGLTRCALGPTIRAVAACLAQINRPPAPTP